MSAVQALESILGIQPTPWIKDMRRLFYCGEWIESHSLHIHLLAAPDFLGFANAIEMAGKHPDIVRRGLRIQEAGNAIISFLGGRSVHPVGVRVGGFWHSPSRAATAKLLAELEALLPEVEALVLWTASLPLPNETQDFECVSLGHAGEYPIMHGRIVSSHGLDIDIAEFDSEFKESHAPHSTALHCHHRGQAYLVGPLARINLNLDQLPAATRKLLEISSMRFPSFNIFHSIVARALEIHVAFVEAIRLLQGYQPTDTPYLEAAPRAGVGFGASEAPRGILWHRYELDEAGGIVSARIVPPTSQNQARMEADLRTSLNHFGLDQPEEKIRQHAETVIRNYDPCISCATHFLKLRIQRP
jgi:coenzyme F420-reducing hydrogenase alpha subunit